MHTKVRHLDIVFVIVDVDHRQYMDRRITVIFDAYKHHIFPMVFRKPGENDNISLSGQKVRSELMGKAVSSWIQRKDRKESTFESSVYERRAEPDKIRVTRSIICARMPASVRRIPAEFDCIVGLITTEFMALCQYASRERRMNNSAEDTHTMSYVLRIELSGEESTECCILSNVLENGCRAEVKIIPFSQRHPPTSYPARTADRRMPRNARHTDQWIRT